MRIRVMIFLFFMVIAGCTSTTKALTLEQVIAAFQNEGMQLHKADENEKNIFQQGINGVTPSFYQLSDGVIYFYIFNSEKERIKGHEDFYHRPVEFVKHKAFVINNVLIFYVYGKNQGNEMDEKINVTLAKLEESN
ncbi:hypothetical protein GC096_16470 [Paenibacillus sp. LMG 31461]|uniref:Lipoprotein n=1 Tax=Paenibacillus plantarum TaxID=2654975 RepID=A0ABX1XCI4_9BACL|nr:hypothetical protein [Paenibacillus plantarum]NOU65630.1 hypothetical protein [Paenibacillus plantarum]